MRTLEIHWPGLPEGIGVLSTLRSGGVSMGAYADAQGKGGLNLGTHVGDVPEAVVKNRALLRSLLPNEPIWLEQVHGTQVVQAHHVSLQKTVPRADASTATTPGAVCTIMTADCMPVLLADASGVAVGAAHAGWRGLANGVLEQSVKHLRESGLGPATNQAFVAMEDKPGKYLGNLPLLARLALKSVGVHQVAGGDRCTLSEPAEFYSFRRDRITGRMATMIWIR